MTSAVQFVGYGADTGENLVREIAIIVDGVWQSLPALDGHNAVDHSNAKLPSYLPTGAIDQVVAHLSQVVMLAQAMSDQDQRRVREFVHAASSTLAATTVLGESDQKLFEAHLKNAVGK